MAEGRSHTQRAEEAGGLVKEESGNINGARVFKNLDIRLRYFGLFLGNWESAEVVNQRSGMIPALFFRGKQSCRENTPR